MPFFSRAAAGLVVIALAAACDSPIGPSRTPIEPSQRQPEPSRPEPSREWPDLTGTYTLTLSVSSRCQLEFPEAMRTRTYTAAIAQEHGWLLTVTLQGPGIYRGWYDIFRGGVGENDEVVFDLLLWQWLDAFEFTGSGKVRATISAGGLSGLLDGRLDASGSNEDRRGSWSATCTAPDHGVVFSR